MGPPPRASGGHAPLVRGAPAAHTVHMAERARTGRDAAASFVHSTQPSGADVLRVAVFRPAGFDAAASWPALLFLHGMGECGGDGRKHLTVGLAPAMLANLERWPFVVLFPQKPVLEDEWRHHEPALLALLDRAASEHRVDPQRVGVTGISQGGHGAWDLARRHPARFAAVAPVCGYPATPARGWREFERARDWSIERAREAAADVADALRGTPVWAAHGTQDPIVPVAFTDVVVEALRARGARPVYERLVGVRHAAWEPAYADPAFAEWLRERLGAR